MADIKISQLGAAIAVGDTDVLPIVSGGNTLKATAAQVKEHSVGNTNISGIGDGSVTGAISSLNSGKQPKTLDTPLTIGGVSKTTVEDALGGLVSENQTLTNNLSDVNRTGTTNSGTLIPKGKYFYLDGVLKVATADIANGATFTSSNTGSGVIGDRLQANNNGQLVGYYATHTWQASEMSNVTSGSITVTNRNGVCSVRFINVVCTANTVLVDATAYIGHVYEYDSDGSGIYIDNGIIYCREANAGYRILTFVN